MVQTRFNTYGSWVLISLGIFLFLFFLAVIKLYFFNKDASKYQVVAFGFIGFVVMLIVCACFINPVSVNLKENTITAYNWFTRSSKTFNFSDLDGFYDTIVEHGRGRQSFKAIVIKRNGEPIIKIDSYYCSNHDELRSSLSSMKYLGININWEKQNFR